MRRVLIPLLLCLSAGLPAAGADPVHCTCPEGEACYHYLHAPVSAPEDPCHCPACRAHPGACSDKLPEGWDPVCAANSKMECFLRRHAASWHLACSEQLAGTCACKNPHPEWCPKCGSNGKPWNDADLAIVRRQVEIEKRIFGTRRKFIVIKSPHFYFVTDVRRLKIWTQDRNWRVLEMHEIAHLFVQRAEIAYEDFVRVFGDDVILPRPCGVYFVEDESTKEAIAQAYIGLPQPELCYGGNYDSIAGGYPYNCCVFSLEKYKHDHDCHHQMRHLIGHLLFSCWKKVGGSNDILPRWIYAGVGHWLARLPPLLSETANFCSGEGAEVHDSGEKWALKVRKYALDDHSIPIEKIFAVNSLGGLDLEMHIRAWSIFDLFLREDRARFVAFLAQIRAGTDQRKALRTTFGLSPGEFDRRWRDRVLGRRESVAPTAAELDAANPDRPGAAERESIRREKDPDLLAAKILALNRVDDPLTARTLVPLLGDPSERVRETAVVVLARSREPKVIGVVRDQGLTAGVPLVRANSARILADHPDAAAGPALLKVASDRYWLARAHAALALARIGYEPAIPTIAGMVDDHVGPARVAAMDALGRYGRRAAIHYSGVVDHLGDASWQARSAAAECLGNLGEQKAIEPLIERMEVESGRIRRDIREALKKLTGDDLGMNPKYWRKWWEKQKGREGPAPAAKSKSDSPYAEPPTYYGLKVFSESIGYVVDTSGSMAYEIHLDEGWLKRNDRAYPAIGSKYDLTSCEIAASLTGLDPRVRFDVWFFRSIATSWQSDLVPASPANVKSALSRIRQEAPQPDLGDHKRRTNYIDVLRKVLAAKADEPPPASFADTPDTLLFLTDGKPTEGDITDPDVILSWMRERNRFARIRLSVITFGSREARYDFLRAFAEQNGGTFVPVPEVK